MKTGSHTKFISVNRHLSSGPEEKLSHYHYALDKEPKIGPFGAKLITFTLCVEI